MDVGDHEGVGVDDVGEPFVVFLLLVGRIYIGMEQRGGANLGFIGKGLMFTLDDFFYFKLKVTVVKRGLRHAYKLQSYHKLWGSFAVVD